MVTLGRAGSGGARRRRGKVSIGCLLLTALIGIAGYVGWAIGQPYWRFYQYQDAMVQEARFAERSDNDAILQHLRAKADTLDLPVEAKKINIRRRQNQIWIWADYTETVALPMFSRDLSFQPHVQETF